MDFKLDDSRQVPLSALQHYAYCPRQCALIHNEQVWAENYHTAEGQILHQRVDSGVPETRKGIRYERGVSVSAEQLWLTGKLDLVEIDLVTGEQKPVEYKRGKPKVEDWDRIQLCAQALCLEEMRNIQVLEGAIWYWEVRRREIVSIDESLRDVTLAAIKSVQILLSTGVTPLPIDDKKRCKGCSLIDLCEPDKFRRDKSSSYVNGIFSE
ncbi:CRISPR-associated protein Cas4 [Cellvibrio japonicus]|nr:CRISPR-associated protein Cas4 [Cellvibrio japonicus]QEI12849.1 CRISPR-associated protein Cas4 [Cellvibrio japonicus]QEI16423.1 CRISPR-associated protein Cas4 [Cellvibrio japonicus]QEI20001.1 CRISPR-associated protein Cas4 [Cellvibrio japonicus]